MPPSTTALGVEVLRRGAVVAAATAAGPDGDAALKVLDRHCSLAVVAHCPTRGPRPSPSLTQLGSATAASSTLAARTLGASGPCGSTTALYTPTCEQAVDTCPILSTVRGQGCGRRVKFTRIRALTRRNAVHLLWMRKVGRDFICPRHLDRPASTARYWPLAVPALGALVAEPLFVLVDSAVVGHLGTAPLAGLALASTVLMTVIGLCVFLAYATTAAVARRLGAGDRRARCRSASTGCGWRWASASRWPR